MVKNVFLAVVFVLHAGVGVPAQGRGQGGPQRPADAQRGAPIELTGYWVSLVTEDWRYRMVTPEKGDFSSVPLNAEGRRLTDQWDPARDAAEGNACKAYGAAALMRVPSRFHITWQDPNTLKIESDAGQQTRLLHFGNAQAPGGFADLQGYSVAAWEAVVGRAALAGGRGQLPAQGGGGGVIETETGRPQYGDLRVETTHLTPGYLRKNGVPYSDKTIVTEYFDRHAEFGNEYLTITTIVHDPAYLAQDFITSTDFKKESDALKWHPAPCSLN